MSLSFELCQFLLVGGTFALDPDALDGWQPALRDQLRHMNVAFRYETREEWAERMKRARVIAAARCAAPQMLRRRVVKGCDTAYIDTKQYSPHLSIKRPLTRQEATVLGCLF